jgi:CsoR family transcriptional regulator, copper-sensing transcriptional repressor
MKRNDKMILKNAEIKDKLVNRLRRVEGQIRGIEEMLNGERDCREIMQQLAAAHSALRSTSRIFFRDYAAACMTETESTGASAATEARREHMVEEMLALLDKTP